MQTPHDLVSRIERLERENRRSKRSILALGLALAGTLVAGFAQPAPQVPEQLVAQAFVLQNAEGKETGRLGPDSTGHPHLTFRGDNGMALLTVNQPGLLVRAADGKRGAFMGVDPRGATRLELTGKEYSDGIRLAVHEEGSSGIYVLNPKGYERVAMEYLSNGNSQFTTRDDQGKVRGFFGQDATGTSSVVLLDSLGGRRIGMLVHPRGDDEEEENPIDVPVFAVQDSKGQLRSELTLDLDDSPSLRMYHVDGKASFSAP